MVAAQPSSEPEEPEVRAAVVEATLEVLAQEQQIREATAAPALVGLMAAAAAALGRQAPTLPDQMPSLLAVMGSHQAFPGRP